MKSLRIPLAACLVTASLQAQAATEIYDVRPAYRQEVVDILSGMLDVDMREFGGSVQLLPTGQILVDTYSDARQEEIRAVLEAIASKEPEPTPTIRLRYWVLHGVAGAEDASDLPSTLDDVVRELEDVHGDLGFEILDAAMLSSMSGEVGVFENDRWEIVQQAFASGEEDRINATLTIEHEFQELHIQLALTRGEFVVLGAGTSAQLVEDGVLALIVNWPEDN
ncbi:MAG: hypothetical protein PVH89_00590 [Gammaproteobacteria bacterium]|jgi:hypothetical protein